MYSVSVIMPVYNNEKTLKRAIESILKQTMYGFELILVDDGSTDGSAQICETYAKKEPLIVEVIHQEHSGRGAALNKGLFNSTGDYVYFADPKDTFDARLLQANIKLAKEKEADLVVFGFRTPAEDKSDKLESHLPRMPILSEKEAFRNHYRNFHHFYPHALFNKLYKREYLFNHRIRFPHLSLREEAFFNINVYKELSSVAFNRNVYCYRNNNVSAKSKSYQEHEFDIQFLFAKRLETMIKDWGYEEEYIDIISELYYDVIYAELRNLRLPDSPLTEEQQVNRINQILADETIQRNLQKFLDLNAKSTHKKRLLSYLCARDGSSALKYVSHKKDTKKPISKLPKLIQKLFKK